jgi:alkanesulfonate monooxygenase SsuD/methylene tetrahydromethanopterin reductase-like flavin-dependent oxidoreductase (luciferase family)
MTSANYKAPESSERTADRAPAGLGRFGVWATSWTAKPELAVAAERLGYGAIWLGSADGELRLVEEMLDATSTITVATGIVNIWANPAGVHAGRRVLAALGPQVLRLSARRGAGAHPYLVTPGYTRWARGILGDAPLLAPEQKVLHDSDPARGRAMAREPVQLHLNLANYVANLRRLGYTDTDLTAPGSDRLVDDLIPHGTAGEVAAKLRAHLKAGADHVAIQLLTGEDADPLPGLTSLAEQLFG